MRRISWTIAILLAGCGGSPDDASPQPSSAPSEAPAVDLVGNPGSPAPLTAGTNTPARVVARFYDALRDGDDKALASLLSDKARSETAKNGLEVLSQEDSSSLSYEIGETEYVTEEMDGAHVASLWIEPDEHGQRVTTKVIWVLRKQTRGWRIAGFAQVFRDELPVLFDLESAEDTMRAKEYVDEEFYGGRETPPMQTATPGLPASTDTRLR